MTNYQPDLSPVFQALADPTRRAVVAQLTGGAAPVGKLAAPFDLALPTFLRHLRVLEDAGLVATEKRGRVRICTLRPDRLAQAERWFADTRKLWDRRLDALGRYLTEEKEEEGNTP
ncbi:MAG: metalloregulator ArsR/SmtB family transcription factor [Pseudomonadota bacterium]